MFDNNTDYNMELDMFHHNKFLNLKMFSSVYQLPSEDDDKYQITI